MDDVIALHVVGAAGTRDVVDIKVSHRAGDNVHALVIDRIMDQANI